MFLPNQLPAQLKKNHRQQNIENAQKPSKMRRIIGRKKKAYDRAEEMLAPPASPSVQQQQQSLKNNNNANNSANLMVRGWARISGRKRHRRKVPNLESNNNNNNISNNFDLVRRDSSSTMSYNTQNGRRGSGHSVESTWPMIGTNSNLARVAHLSENFNNRMDEDGIERKRHFLNRGMDRIRRSFRRSFRKSGPSGCHQLQALTQSSATSNDATGAGGGSGAAHNQSVIDAQSSGSGGAPKNYCHADEIAVRSTACSFAVKYFGACEVFESRGMSVCESALQHLRARKRAIKVLLYISGDGIRVVDQEHNRGLIVDQTIEKVSFCAPDRSNEKGFSYICRDGATRRWMCHGFHASKDTGERLSHAVGCAFTVCLEKKRKRDAETAAYRNAQALAHTVELDSGIEDNCGAEFARTNQGYRSFRHLSISERRSDPQKAILVVGHAQSSTTNISNNTTTTTKITSNSMPSIPSTASTIMHQPTTPLISTNSSTPRPCANPTLFERSGSLRAPICSSTVTYANNANAMNLADHHNHHHQIATVSASSFARFHSLPPKKEGAGAKRFSIGTMMPRMSLHNEPIWEGDLEEEIGIGGTDCGGDGNGTETTDYANGWDFFSRHRSGANGRERFYRTLPHTMPSLAPTNWCTFESSILSTTIAEEEKQCNSRESPSPADPFHTKLEGHNSLQQCQPTPSIFSSASVVRADHWLAETLQKAASLSVLAKKSDHHDHGTTVLEPTTMSAQMTHSKSFGIGCAPSLGQMSSQQQQNLKTNANNAMMVVQRLAVITNNSMLPSNAVVISNSSTSAPIITRATDDNSDLSPATANRWGNQQQSPQLPQSPPVVRATGDIADTSATETLAIARGDPSTAATTSATTNGGGGGGATGRKPSRQIEYQLLQETAHPHSPPPLGAKSQLLETQQHQQTTNVIAVDPFDVNWSQRVLEQSALKLRSPRAPPAIPERHTKTNDQKIDQQCDQKMAFDQCNEKRTECDQRSDQKAADYQRSDQKTADNYQWSDQKTAFDQCNEKRTECDQRSDQKTADNHLKSDQKTADNQRSDQNTVDNHQWSDQKMEFEQNNPFSNGKTPTVNV